MRRVAPLLLLSFLVPSPSAASAQTTLFLTGGVNFTYLATETGLQANYNSAKRPFTGLAATIPIAGPFQVRLGGAYSQKGNFYGLDRLVPTDPDYPTFGTLEPAWDVHLRMGYLEFSALGGLASPVSGGPVSVHALLGPAVAFLASCKATATEYVDGRLGESTTVSCPEDVDIAKLDFGLAAGGGLTVDLTDRVGVTAGLLYTRGLKDSGDVWVGSDPGSHNDTIELSARHRVVTLNAGVTYAIR